MSRGHLYRLLNNPIYIGEIRHKDATYPGQHDPIVNWETFDAVRRLLKAASTGRRSMTNAKTPSLLAGLVYDETGDRLCPTHANKKGQRYRYYISKRLMHRTGSTEGGWHLPAKELGRAVVQTARDFVRDELGLIDALDLTSLESNRMRAILRRAAALASDLDDSAHDPQRRILHQLLHRITLHPGSIHIALKRFGLGTAIFGETADKAAQPPELIQLTAPVVLKRRGVEAKLIVGSAQDETATPDADLVALLVLAHRWFGQLARGELQSAKEIVRRDGFDPARSAAPYSSHSWRPI